GARDAAVFGVFSLNGERCTAGSRVLVERPIYEDFVTAFGTRAGAVRIGPPSEPATELGPLIHPDHLARVLSYVELGVQEGARLVAGGSPPAPLSHRHLVAAPLFPALTPP